MSNRRKNGDGNWGKREINGVNYLYYRRKYPGLKSAKTFYGKTEKEVNEKRFTFENDIKNQEVISSDKTLKISLYDYTINWLNSEHKHNIKPTTKDGYLDCINSYLKNYDIANVQISDLNDKMFKSYIKELSSKYSRSTVKKIYAIMSLCLDYAFEDKRITQNYIKKVKIPSEDNVANKRKDIQFLEYDDMIKLFNEEQRVCTKENRVNGISIGEKVYGINSKIIVFICFSGMRIGECISLKWGDVDYKNNIISVRTNLTKIRDENEKYIWNEGTTKTKKGYRSIPLCQQTISILNSIERKSDNDYIFHTKNNTIPTKRNITRTLNSMQKRAKCKCERCGLHALRHSFGSMLILNGVDIKVVSEILGHKDVTFTYNTYIHIVDKQKMKAVDVFNTQIDKDESEDIIEFLKSNGYRIAEVEEGILGYIKNMNIVKLIFSESIIVNGRKIQCKDIYNQFYK